MTVLYTSPLKRAYSTAVSVQQYQSKELELNVKPDLWEQTFGVAEGHPWVLTHPAIDAAMSNPNSDEALEKAILDLAAQGIFPDIIDRIHKFPGGESLGDVAIRAERVLKESILAHFADYVANGTMEDVHVVVVSHSVWISEVMTALVALDPQADHAVSYKGLVNTAWTRAVISVRVCHFLISVPACALTFILLQDKFASSFESSNPGPLEVKVTHFNNFDHLKSLVITDPFGVFYTNIGRNSRIQKLDDTCAGATIVKLNATGPR